MKENDRLGFFYGFLSALTTAMMPVLVKIIPEVSAETMVFFRFFISFLCITPAIILGRAKIRFKNAGGHFFRSCAALISLFCFFYSIKHLSLINAVTLKNTAPLFIPILILIRYRVLIPWGEIAALVMGFIGVLIILQPGSDIHQWAAAIGVLGGLTASMGRLTVKGLTKEEESTETLMANYFLISAVLSFFPMAYTWKPIDSKMAWLVLILLGIISLLSQYFKTKSLTYSATTKMGVLSYIGVVLSGLFGWLLFHEVPTPWEYVGIAFIVGAGLIAMMYKQKTRKS